jgi:GR25 family glycosyltransferase involved in LPS biosynthesis
MASTKKSKSGSNQPLLTDWFDKVYVINCAHRPDRLADFRQEIETKKIADLSKITVYPAVIGDYTTYPAGWKADSGAWGCLNSHKRILEDLMHIRDERGAMDWESALVLEDDVFFLDGALAQLAEFMTAIPGEWGQLYLGGQHRQTPAATASPKVIVGNSVNRTHAYAVHRDHIQKLYRHISYMKDYMGTAKHIDHQLELAHRRKDWPVYCPPRWICGQRAGTSNISGKTLEAQVWQRNDKKATEPLVRKP